MNSNHLPGPAPADTLSTLVEIVPVPLAFIDRSFRFVFANQAAASQLGLPSEMVQGRLVAEAIPGFWPELKVLLERVLAGETIVDIDVDLSELSAERREWTGSFYPVREGDEVVAVACTSVDVTSFRDVERELKARNDLFAMLARINSAVSRSESKEELFEEICELAYRTGNFYFAWVGVPKDGAIVAAASAGTDNEMMRKIDWSELAASTDPDDPRSSGPTGQAYITGEISVVNDLLSSARTELWRTAVRNVGFHGAAALPIREHGRVVAVLTLYAEHENFFTEDFVRTLAEITPSLSLAMDRFELERSRQVNEAELILRDRALTAATQGVVITDARAEDNPIIYVTPALEDLTGYKTEEFIGKNCRMLQGEDTDRSEIKKVQVAIDERRSCEVELVNYRKSGEPFWNRLTISPILDDSGTLTHFVGVLTDVTGRRMLENQVRQAQKMEAVGLLAGGIAHDFNNLLTAIRGSADLALAEVGSGPAREDLLHIDEAAEHAARLTGQLLAFSSQQVLKPQSTDLNQVVVETTGLVSRLIGDDIELEERLGDSLEAVLVDRAQIQQVIMNLAINARDAMARGGTIVVETTSCDLDESYVANGLVPRAGRYALLEVGDNGSGMDAATQAKVFEPFFTTKSDGTGLGLATVYGIVSQSGGHVAVESELGVGTRFKIYLPTTEREIAPTHAAVGEQNSAVDGSETILHVEDSELLRPLVARVLNRAGYEVLSAANSIEALEIANKRAGTIDLMLTDIVMPGLNGRELSEILIGQYPALKVLFTSGYPADMVIRQGIAEAEVNFIEKPFLAKDLLPLIRSILDTSTRAA